MFPYGCTYLAMWFFLALLVPGTGKEVGGDEWSDSERIIRGRVVPI